MSTHTFTLTYLGILLCCCWCKGCKRWCEETWTCIQTIWLVMHILCVTCTSLIVDTWWSCDGTVLVVTRKRGRSKHKISFNMFV